MSSSTEKIKSVILGHAVADALGVPVEFVPRKKLDNDPVTDMRGFGVYPYPEGSWSDDTSMSLATLDSLAGGKVDFDEIMQNFERWLTENDYTPTGETFDAGRTCIRAVTNYFANGMKATESGPVKEHSNGNGSLMRILPFVLYAVYGGYKGNHFELIHEASRLTHGHRRSQIACGIYASIMYQLLKNPIKASVHLGLAMAFEKYKGEAEFNHYIRIFSPDFSDTDRDNINSSGYVVDTLEAAIWCLLTTDNYKDCVLKAVNLGEDTDTVAAVAGGMAGALYGYEGIPKKWLAVLKRREYIEEMCDRAASEWLENSKVPQEHQ